MKQHRVPGSPHRCQTGRGSLCCQHDLTVGVEQCEGHKREIQPIKHTVLVIDRRIGEDNRVVTENDPVEETRRLFERDDEEVSDWRDGSQDKDDPDKEEGAGHRAHVAVV